MAKAKKLLVREDEKNDVLSNLQANGLEYLELKAMNKENEKAISRIKEDNLAIIRELGTPDLKGTIVLETDFVVFTIQKRCSPVINIDEAEKILKEKGLYLKATKRVLDPERITGLHLEGHLTDSDVSMFMEQKEVEAFVVERKKG
jgi:hypothetical protein